MMNKDIQEPTDEQIMALIQKCNDDPYYDLARVIVPNLIVALPFEKAVDTGVVNPSATAEDWKQFEQDRTEKTASAKKKMISYLPFAWEKANGMRGLSASRSLDHIGSYLFLMGIDVMTEIKSYKYYGKQHLLAVSEAFDFPWQGYDDGFWANSENAKHQPGAMVSSNILEKFL